MSAEEKAVADKENEGDEADEDVPEVAEATGPPAHEPFSVKIFNVAKEQQASNGLRHNDHLRYRQYCTRRLRRLRCTLRWKNAGRGRGKPAAFPGDFKDLRFLEFPLVCAERAWSYGVQLKSDNAQAGTWQPRWRLHSIRRFHKAVKWADFLETACKRHGDQRTQREAEAYSNFMSATLLLEKEEWSEALTKFTRCRQVCENLALASDAEESKIFKEHVQLLAPSIRECRYNLGLGQAEDDAEDPASKSGKSGGIELSGLCYRGQGLISPPEKIKAQLLKCLQLSSAISVETTEVSAAVNEKYGELSAEFGDVLKDIHTDMISASDSKEASSEGPSESEWRLLEAFARERSVCKNVERNLVLLRNHLAKLDSLEEIGSHKARNTCRPEMGMHYCDLLKEDIESLLELPETSTAISAGLATYISVARNCRCFFLALCHSLTGKSLEAAALFDMLRLRLEDTVLEVALEEPLGHLHTLFEEVVKAMPSRVSQWRCRLLASLCSKAPKLKDQTEAEDAEAVAVAFPPRVKEIPCKPLLFDLAFPCLEAPDLDQLLPQKGAASDGQKGPGILGRVAGGVRGSLTSLGGLWGRGQK